MKVLNSLAYFVGYYRRRMLNAMKIILLLAFAFVVLYAVMHLSGLSVELKKADIVLWHIS
jgi:hypothetical protein